MTAQAHENLIYNGKHTSMASCPPLPESHSGIIKLNREEITDEDSIAFSTACWRGYIGTWGIKDGKFYLVNIIGQYKIAGNSPVFADWFSGVIRVPQGEILHYVHMGFASVYEEDILITIEKGEVVESRIVDNRNRNFDELKPGLRNPRRPESNYDGDNGM